jgi:hypothetical protein
MRTITETFAAGEIKAFGIPGERFELISSVNPVTVSMQDANGIELTNGLSQNLIAGSYMQEGKFFRLAIQSATAQTITFVIANGDSGTRSVAGTVAVAGTVSVAGAVNINDVIAAGCRTDNFVAAGTVGVNQVTQHIAPGTNVNGILLRNIDISVATGAGGAAALRLIAGLVAPVQYSHSGPNSISLASVSNNAASVTLNKAVDTMSRRLPPGWGIWSIASVYTSAASNNASISYEIL